MKNYQAVVNDKITVDLTSEQPHALPARGKVVKSDFYRRAYRVRINGGYYDVVIKNALDLLIDQMGLAHAASSSAADLQAPMPGLIVDVLVAEGDEIKKGDPLLILEAMKMENKLTSAVDGIVQSVLVKAGDTVEKNTTLIEFEK